MTRKLRVGNCLEVMQQLPENSVDTILTDPPYGLSFMGKEWDHGVPGQLFWEEALRVAKPGATLLAFGGRTHHRLACAIEDAGWEIRDYIFWAYGSGFPKSHNISKAIDKAAGVEREVVGTRISRQPTGNAYAQDKWTKEHGIPQEIDITVPATPDAELWDGWGTALKPAVEPVVMAMKPRDGTFANNALTHGVAGLWIDGGRIHTADKLVAGGKLRPNSGDTRDGAALGMFQEGTENTFKQNSAGRWPANLILDEEAARMLDESTGTLTSGTMKAGTQRKASKGLGGYHDNFPDEATAVDTYGDSGGPSRFFYCAKASRSERNAGLDNIIPQQRDLSRSPEQKAMNNGEGNPYNRGVTPVHNHHPTVKPLDLMRYLVRLTRTPTGGTVLDPFMGSGTTGIACVLENRDFIGIDIEQDYVDIAEARIDYWAKNRTHEISLFE